MGQLASGAFDGSGTGVFTGGANERTVVAVYDFAVNGGAVSSIAIGTLPLGAVVTGGFMIVNTALAGGAASVGIDSEGTGDVVASASIAGAPWSTTGKKAIVPKTNTPETTSITTTAARNINFTITGATLSAGKVTLYLYVQNAN